MKKSRFMEGFNYNYDQKNGNPIFFKSDKALSERVDEYFAYERQRFTTTGLALFLGFASRQSLYDYEKRSEPFSYIIKRAITVIESGYETNLHGTTPTGSIFALKNMGWREETHTNLTNDGKAFETPKIQFTQ
jgi:hypothetical protein